MSHDHSHAHGDHHDSIAHPLPFKLLLSIFLWLMLFTFLTVAATWIDLGNLNIVLALTIAFIKAVLVCMYFMHLRYESPLYSVILVGALMFVALFMGIALIDSHQYEPTIQARINAELKAAAADAVQQ